MFCCQPTSSHTHKQKSHTLFPRPMSRMLYQREISFCSHMPFTLTLHHTHAPTDCLTESSFIPLFHLVILPQHQIMYISRHVKKTWQLLVPNNVCLALALMYAVHANKHTYLSFPSCALGKGKGFLLGWLQECSAAVFHWYIFHCL